VDFPFNVEKQNNPFEKCVAEQNPKVTVHIFLGMPLGRGPSQHPSPPPRTCPAFPDDGRLGERRDRGRRSRLALSRARVADAWGGLRCDADSAGILWGQQKVIWTTTAFYGTGLGGNPPPYILENRERTFSVTPNRFSAAPKVHSGRSRVGYGVSARGQFTTALVHRSPPPPPPTADAIAHAGPRLGLVLRLVSGSVTSSSTHAP